jgi:hypothetical protein
MSPKSAKIDAQAEAALHQSDSKTIAIDLTPELKAKYSRVTGLVVDLLRANSESPFEAYMMLKFCQSAFEELFGIRGLRSLLTVLSPRSPRPARP